MKKCLLIIVAAASVNASAQTRRMAPISPSQTASAPQSNLVYSEPVNPTAIISTHVRPQNAHRNGGGNHSQTVSVIPIGFAGNAFGCAFGPKTFLWYDKDLNSITFSHRTDPVHHPDDVTTGALRYDLSVDGGNTWAVDQGAVYENRDNTLRARYPQGLIYNPIGNTNPSNAYFTFYAPITDNTNWVAHVHGTGRLGMADSVWTRDLFADGLNGLIPHGFQIIKNTTNLWNSDIAYIAAAYADSIIMSKGVWNGSNDFNYTHNSFPAWLDFDNTGAKMYVAHSMAWNDNGQIGYVAIIGNDLVSDRNDSMYYLIIYKTSDGGVSWNKLESPALSDVDPDLLNGMYLYTTGFECDAVVDANDNLHIALAIGPAAAGLSIGTAYGNWGLFDIYTTDGGTLWYGKLLDKPQTFRGTFGDGSTANPTISEDSRPHASRTWDGSKVFFTWFDTDSAEFGVTTNTFPDAKCIGYDLASNQWTNVTDLTDLTDADGLCTFGNVSYYVIELGGSFGIPITYQTLLDPIQTGSPTSFFYINGAAVSSFTQPGGEILLSHYVGVPKITGTTSLAVSGNYPNPFTGKTSVNVSLVKVSDVVIEVSNMLGEVLSTTTYSNLHSGVNVLTVDASNFAKGLYTYKVKAGSEVVAKTMSVQ